MRLASGAVTLLALVAFQRRSVNRSLRELLAASDWSSAVLLLGYAAFFSFAYVSLNSGTGALLLFAAVQATMIGWGIRSGERLRSQQTSGLFLAISGVAWLLLPGATMPDPLSALMMAMAGMAWGGYSIRGRATSTPLPATAGNFLRALPLGLPLLFVASMQHLTMPGLVYACASGALASGMGYAIWYAVLPRLRTTTAASVQLTVPIITAFGGVLLLGESVTIRLGLAAVFVVGGLFVFLRFQDKKTTA